MKRTANFQELGPITLSLAVFLTSHLVSAQESMDKKSAFKDSKTVNSGSITMPPTPYPKFIALEAALGASAINWKEVMNRTEVDVDPDSIKDTKVAMPALLGFRICDGIMAIKARDAEKLNACAGDIEKMGKKLGVTDKDLERAKRVRSFANRGEWGMVYLDLGYLQQDIETVLQRESGQGGRAPVRKILYAAGWLQGARYVSSLVKQNYNAKTAGILREPLLVKELKSDLDGCGFSENGIIKCMSSALGDLQKIVDVPLREGVAKEGVDNMADLAAKAVIQCAKDAKQ